MFYLYCAIAFVFSFPMLYVIYTIAIGKIYYYILSKQIPFIPKFSLVLSQNSKSAHVKQMQESPSDFFRKESAPIGSLKGQLPDMLRPTFDNEDTFKDVLVMVFEGKNSPYHVDICTVCNEIHCYPSSFVVHPNTSIHVVFRSLFRHKIQKSTEGSPIVVFKNKQNWFIKYISSKS